MPGPTWRLLAPFAVLLVGCDLPGLTSAGGATSPASLTSTLADINAAVGKATSDEDRAHAILDVAARELTCPRDSVALAMTFDRRYGNSFSLRYLVEACGTRALYGEDCTHMDACRYVLVSRMPLDGLERLAPVTVPARIAVPSMPLELAGLSVSLEPHVVGALAHGDTPEKALAACRHGDAELVRAMGWTVAADPAKANLVARFGCTGHIDLQTHGGTVDMTLPYDGSASVVLLAGERVVVTVPASPTHLTCDSHAVDMQTDCLQRAGAMTSARIALAIAASPELKELARSRPRAGD